MTTKTPLFLLCLLAFAGCAEKSTGSKVVNQYYTGNGLTNTNTNTPTPTVTDPTTSDATCGIARPSGVTTCYKTIPTITLSGSGFRDTNYVPYWNSTSYVAATGVSPNQFRTDGSFSVRIRPETVYGGTSQNPSGSRNCSQYTNLNYSKMRVEMRLRMAGSPVSSGEVIVLTGDVGGVSNTGRFTNFPTTSSPYILEVLSVLTNHRCSRLYGSLDATQTAACNNGTGFFDIPINSTGSVPTECVGFKIEMATDSTKDLPN